MIIAQVKYVKIVFFVAFILIIPLFSPEVIEILSIGILILGILLLSGENTFIFFSIVSLLTLTNSIDQHLRIYIQLLNLIILFYLFLKNYGLKVSQYPTIPNLLKILIFFIYLSMFFSTLFSQYPVLGLVQILRMSVFFLITYFIYSLLRRDSDIRILLISLITIGIIYSFVMFSELANDNFNFVNLNLHRIQKVSVDYLNWNTIGSFIIVIFPILFSFYLGNKKAITKKILIILLIILGLGLFIANSRAAILGVFISCSYLLFNLNKKVFKISAIIFLIMISSLLISPVSDFIDIYLRLDRLTSGRDVIWSVITNIIKDNPFLGSGPAATKYSFYNHLTVLLGSPEEKLLSYHYGEIEFGHAHNFYLFFWSDLGLLGLFTSILLPYIFFKLGFLNFRKLKTTENEYYYLNLGIIASGIGLFIRAIFEWSSLISYGTITLDLPFWILIMILCYINNNLNVLSRNNSLLF